MQYILRIIHTICVLLCFVVVGRQTILPMSSRITSLALGQSYDYPVATKEPWKIWVNEADEFTLQWRHNERESVSNHQRHECLLNRLFRGKSKKHRSPASLAFVRGIHRSPVNSPHKGPVTRKILSFDNVTMIKNWRCKAKQSKVEKNCVQYILWDVLYMCGLTN